MVKCGVLFQVRAEFLSYYLDELRLQRVKTTACLDETTVSFCEHDSMRLLSSVYGPPYSTKGCLRAVIAPGRSPGAVLSAA
jgi:hypothetical protein